MNGFVHNDVTEVGAFPFSKGKVETKMECGVCTLKSTNTLRYFDLLLRRVVLTPESCLALVCASPLQFK